MGRHPFREREACAFLCTLAAFDAALQAIEAPAFILGTGGAILEANTAARRLLADNPGRALRALAEAVARRPSDLAVNITPLRGERHSGFLAVVRSPTGNGRLAKKVGRATVLWKLTPRQADVLDLVARGLTNATVGEMLGIAATTVEYHLTGVFDRAGVDNRATLIARLVEL